MPRLPRIVLKKGKEKSLLLRHPWIFAGAVARMEAEIQPGDLVEVYSFEGDFLAIGDANPASQIVFRSLVFKKEVPDIRELLRRRILRAAQLRKAWLCGATNAYRLVNGEGDFLPGMILDNYGDTMVVQLLSAGMERRKKEVVEILAKEFSPRTIYERSDVPARKEEGLPLSSGLLYGEDPVHPVRITENGSRFLVDIKQGQKTGFYLDQRENRLALRQISQGRRVLDVFSYTGGFSIQAALGKAAETVLVDSSAEALEMAERNFLENGLGDFPRSFLKKDAFDAVRELQPGFDIAVLDPPPFARKKRHVPRASRGYKELNLQLFRLLKKGGFLFTFSCSHHISIDLFQKIVFGAARDAERKVQVIGRLGHAADHPVNLCHPEGEYLKGLICYVT